MTALLEHLDCSAVRDEVLLRVNGYLVDCSCMPLKSLLYLKQCCTVINCQFSNILSL